MLGHAHEIGRAVPTVSTSRIPEEDEIEIFAVTRIEFGIVIIGHECPTLAVEIELPNPDGFVTIDIRFDRTASGDLLEDQDGIRHIGWCFHFSVVCLLVNFRLPQMQTPTIGFLGSQDEVKGSFKFVTFFC